MPITAGARLGSYEILSLLGSGGMGEVYRARDTRLGRDVAVKVLPDLLASDPDRLARFQREAQVLASLNHPNIAAIYGLEESGGIRALILELVEGETLAERIHASKGLALSDSLNIARQIADALEAAHEKGIVHRDLKPANIKVTPEGVVKVLDFGLAKALADDPAGPDASHAPTLTAAPTRLGVILGTAAYMSPEQARGKAVDKRGDIWAFGCVLYEMLTGKRTFDGAEISDTLAFVITKEPNWSAVPETTPAPIRKLLRRCLEKDRKRRLADISDARFEIDEALMPADVGRTFSGPPQLPDPIGSGLRTSPRQSVLPWAVAGVAALAAVTTLVWWAPWRAVPPPMPLRLEAALGADASLTTGVAAIGPVTAAGGLAGPAVGAGGPGGGPAGAAAVLSPDGSMLAFVAVRTAGSGTSDFQQRLYIRRLDQLQATLLTGTDGASSPFFSPDGQWIAFFADGRLKKIAVSGGAAVTLCDAPSGRGGSWAEDGTIVFQPVATSLAGDGLLFRVSSAGGQPERLTTRGDNEVVSHRFPQVLPGGRAVLYTANAGSAGDYSNANLVVQPLPTGQSRIVHRGGYYGRYLPSGHLVYVRDGTLFAMPFDLDRLETMGAPAPVLDGVTSNPGSGGAQFAVSANGTLVYLEGSSTGGGQRAPIHWMDRGAKTMPLRATPSVWGVPRFSPDGRRLALMISDGQQSDIWVYEWERDTLTRLTFDPTLEIKPVWTPDGRRIAFGSPRGDTGRSAAGVLNLHWQRSDGTGEIERLTESTVPQLPDSFHPSGKFLAYHEGNPVINQQNIMILPIEGDEASGWKPGKPTLFLGGPFIKAEVMFSPDGKWLAYVTNETGRFEVYVRPFPGPGGKWQISSGGGNNPRWSPTRRELLYSTLQGGQIMAVPYAVEGETFRLETPRVWSEGRFSGTAPIATYGAVYDLHPDGERVAVMPVQEVPAAPRQDKLVFVFNFFEELRRIAPTTKQ